jgi:putative aminopeptidase FrvX
MNPSARAFLDDLLRAHGPSGHEDPAAAVWRRYAESFATVEGDVVGNSYARVGPADGPAVLLLGHLDEIGLIVTHILDRGSDAGLARVRPLGSWDPQVLVGQHVQVRRADGGIVPGVIGKGPRHLLTASDMTTASKLEDLWLDVGARDASDAAKLISVGDTIVVDRPPRMLANNRIAGRAMDNRTGAWVVAEAARRAAEIGLSVPVIAGAPVIEETLGDGARVMAHRTAPVVSIVVDVTHSSDVPTIDPGQTGRVLLGHGPVLTRGLGLHPGLYERLAATAITHQIPVQLEAMHVTKSTLTDVDGALDALAASAVALVSIPLRHMHSPSEVASLDDVDACAELIARTLVTLVPDERWVR